jgi:7-cyano-7-deazaguanine synthase
LPGLRSRLGADTVLDIPTITQIGATAMTSDVEIEMGANGLPTTFVPARNLLFLTFAASLAYRRGIKHIVTGVCETDYSGYPDCRDDTIKALQVALNLGMATRLVLHTPLMFIDKAGTWELAYELGEKHFPVNGVSSVVGGDEVVLVIAEESHSCYVGDRSHWHEWGFGCGRCPACELRANGWHRWVQMRAGKKRITTSEASA